MSQSPLPSKLSHDAIVEALVEVRCESDEVPEVIIGRLSDFPEWKTYAKKRLAVSDIPAPIRDADANLKYQALMELRDETGTRVIKIGTSVLSYHILGVEQYVGWEKFKPLLETAIRAIFEVVDGVTVRRIGLRYTNALSQERHYIEGVRSLSLVVTVADVPVDEPLNLNYQVTHGSEHTSLTRIASPKFVKGNPAPDSTAIVDIDVFTPGDFSSSDMNEVMNWVELAHEFEKSDFFRLLPEDVVTRLKEG